MNSCEVEVLEQLRQSVRAYLKSADAAHDWEHIVRVEKCAAFLLAKESGPVDEFVVRASAVAHDVGDFKITKCKLLSRDHLESVILPFADRMPKDRLLRVLRIVECISFRSELSEGSQSAEELTIKQSKEFAIVQDADRLDALGAVGLARCFGFTGAVGRCLIAPGKVRWDPADMPTAAQYNAALLSNTGDSIQHIREKLLHISGKMKTAQGRQIAKEREEFIITFLKRLNFEINEQMS